MYIAGAKSEEHCFNICRGIFDWVLCSLAEPPMTSSLLVQKRKYLWNEKRYSKKVNAIFLYFKKPFK